MSTWPANQIRPYLDYLIVECGLADNTIQSYGRDLRNFADYCQEKGIANPKDVCPLVIQQYAQSLYVKNLATASIARQLVAVRMFMRYHALMGLIAKDVCAALETPKTWKRLPHVLGREQTVDLITAVDPEGSLYLRDRSLLELLYATGMRASEVVSIRVKDVNLQIQFLRCFGKGKKERIIPIHETAHIILRQYLEELRPKLIKDLSVEEVFVSRTGRPLSRIEIWRIVKRAALRAGMTGQITPHTLRHCFGSHLLQGGADLRTVQELLGHADVATTQIYTHVDHDHLRNIHKKFHPMS